MSSYSRPQAYDPIAIRFIGGAGVAFNGAPPAAAPARSVNNAIATYEGRTENGYFRFSITRAVNVRRMLISAGDAVSWTLGVYHDVLKDQLVKETALTDSATEGSNLVRLDLDLVLLPGDALVLRTVGNTTAVVAEAVGFVESNVIGERA